MNPPPDTPLDRILHDLQERAKELNCLYRVDELLGREDSPVDEVLADVVRTLPAGWQFPDVCAARIILGSRVYEPPAFQAFSDTVAGFDGSSLRSRIAEKTM